MLYDDTGDLGDVAAAVEWGTVKQRLLWDEAAEEWQRVQRVAAATVTPPRNYAPVVE
jgi:hypothetical protein